MAAASFPDGIIGPVSLKPALVTKTGALTPFAAFIEYSGTIVAPPGITNVGMQGFDFHPTISWSTGQVFATVPAFLARPTYAPLTAVTDTLSILSGFLAQPVYNPAGGVTPLVAGYSAEVVIGAFTGTVTEVIGYNFRTVLGGNVAVGANAVVAKVCGLRMGNASGSGTVTEQVGVDLDALTKGTTNLSLRSAGASAEMRHLGSAVFGANATRTNASVALEVQSTTQALLLSRMTTTQRDAMTGVNGMLIYNSTLSAVQGFVAGAWASL